MAEPKKTTPRYLALGTRYKERKNNPPPGLKWRSVTLDESGKVKDKQTLESIAEEYSLRPIDLVLRNWDTADVDEINWYLYNYVGCRQHNGKWYTFSNSDNPGMLLVPDMPLSHKKSPLKSVDAIRGGAAKANSQLQVQVIEWLANGKTIDVSGKWLYVFSGQGSVNFGYDPPPDPPRKDAGADGQPGSAFTLDFPGVFHLKEKPDKLEYEIHITSDKPPSPDTLNHATGKSSSGEPKYKFGNNWYLLDHKALQKATSENREQRTSHGFSKSKTVSIDLSQNKRFYFLLSPVQLGPEAIKYAMNNPGGLTPLIKGNVKLGLWDPKDPNQNMGPTLADIERNPIPLRVIDPYAWAQNIVEDVYQDGLKQYVDWISSKQNPTIKELQAKTGWEPDHLYVAQILKSVRDSHKKPGSIDAELKEPAKWKKDLEIWEKELVQRNAELTADAHRNLIELFEWLNGPAHQIIDTAILKDTNANSSEDSMDLGLGITHWADCLEYMFALEPGVVYLRDKLKRPGSFPYEILLKYFKDLDKDTFNFKPSNTQTKGFRWGNEGMLKLLWLDNFVSSSPAVPTNATQQEVEKKNAEYLKKRRDNLIKFFNEQQILPVKLQAPASLPGVSGGGANYTIISTVTNSSLDFLDKVFTYIIDPDINIPRKNWVLNRLANLEEWFQKRPAAAKFTAKGVGYTLKIAALGIGSYNLYTAITTARWDYQKNESTVSKLDWFSASSGATMAVQDVLAEIAALSKRAGMQRLFPQLMVTSGGPKWGVGAVQGLTVAGKVFAFVNVTAMIVSGVTTMIMMHDSLKQAYARGDYTAAKFYFAGAVGGAVMVTGAAVFGLSLMKIGWVFGATGAGATIGIVLFFVGGIVAAIATIGGWLFSSDDDYQVFARKCFLGKEGHKEPRFEHTYTAWHGGLASSNDPPDWSHASEEGPKSWEIDKQKRAIINLLGRFNLKTKPENFDSNKQSYRGTLKLEITPGLFPIGSTVEVALHYSGNSSETSAVLEWNPNSKGSFERLTFAKSGIFDVEKIDAIFNSPDGKTVKSISVYAYNLDYELNKGTLLTTVSVRYPNNKDNVIRTRKLVIGLDIPTDAPEAAKRFVQGRTIQIKADDNEETSGLFE